MTKFFLSCFLFLLSSGVQSQLVKKGAENTNRPNAFIDHGVASPYSTSRGTVAATDGDGRNVVLSWLFDDRGGYALLMVDAETGKSQTYPMPFEMGGDCPYASVFSSKGKLYTLFNSNFVEFDPQKRAFTFHHKTARQMAMGMTEDDQGRVWAVTYPNSGVVSYDPATGVFTDYGYLNKENWAQYQRFMATDDQGWVYFAIGNTNTQIIGFNPATKETKKLLQPAERKRGTAYLYRNKNGKIYGQALRSQDEGWYEIYKGEIKSIGTGHVANPKTIITGAQDLRHFAFPNGGTVLRFDLITKTLITEDVSKKQTEVSFDYASEGSWVMGVGISTDGRSVIGGSSFPMRHFNYQVVENKWTSIPAIGQYNALVTDKNLVFFGSYPQGNLVMWDTKKPFKNQAADAKENNPRILFTSKPTINRPHRVFVHSDHKTVILAGTPDYGYTGGGLLFYDISTNQSVLLKDTDIEKDQSTMSLTQIGKGKVLGGTTISPGTGGEQKAQLALLYIIDPITKKVEWKDAVIPGARTYSDLVTRKDGKVYGFANDIIFFVFDPVTKKVVYQKNVQSEFGRAVGEQSPRVFVKGKGTDLYILFQNSIGKVDHKTNAIQLLAKTPQPMRAGGGFLNNRIYYVSGSHLFSYGL